MKRHAKQKQRVRMLGASVGILKWRSSQMPTRYTDAAIEKMEARGNPAIVIPYKGHHTGIRWSKKL